MKKIIILFVILFGIVLAIQFSSRLDLQNLKFGNDKTPKVKIKDKTFKLSVAKTLKEKQVGLSETKSLPKDQGMIFPFEKADFYPFWMKNMKMPIDIIYIKGDKIVSLFANVQPPKSNETPQIIKPKEAADKVLEINAGLLNEYKIKEGDIVKIENL